MAVKQVDLFDLPSMYTNRSNWVSLDTVDTLAFGSPFKFPRALGWSLPFGSAFTVTDPAHNFLVASCKHPATLPSARLSFLSSRDDNYGEDFLDVLDELVRLSANHGAFHMTAETADRSISDGILRAQGFSPFSNQTIFVVDKKATDQTKAKWQLVDKDLAFAAKLMYEQVTPPIMLAVEPFCLNGCHWYALGGGQAFARVVVGPTGIVIVPLALPHSQIMGGEYVVLAHQLGQGNRLPFYFVVRSQLGWLLQSFSENGFTNLRDEKVLVKHLAKPVWANSELAQNNTKNISIQASHIKQNGNR